MPRAHNDEFATFVRSAAGNGASVPELALLKSIRAPSNTPVDQELYECVLARLRSALDDAGALMHVRLGELSAAANTQAAPGILNRCETDRPTPAERTRTR